MINSLPSHIADALVIIFADDTNAVLSSTYDKLNDLLTKTINCILQVKHWMKCQFLALNVDKTKLMVIGKKYHVKKIGKISINVEGEVINSVESIKSLGL